MIGKFIDTVLKEEELPKTLTSYSPCFRKEKGAHGIEERGVYRIHQFEKQEMIVVCKPEDSMKWYDKLWQNTVDLFRSLDIPVRTLECCSGDLADLKVKSVDVEAWSPRQQKYFEVGSCSNLGDAQARRLKIRVNGENGKYFAHTLNNTVVAPPRMLIARDITAIYGRKSGDPVESAESRIIERKKMFSCDNERHGKASSFLAFIGRLIVFCVERAETWEGKLFFQSCKSDKNCRLCD